MIKLHNMLSIIILMVIKLAKALALMYIVGILPSFLTEIDIVFYSRNGVDVKYEHDSLEI